MENLQKRHKTYLILWKKFIIMPENFYNVLYTVNNK